MENLYTFSPCTDCKNTSLWPKLCHYNGSMPKKYLLSFRCYDNCCRYQHQVFDTKKAVINTRLNIRANWYHHDECNKWKKGRFHKNILKLEKLVRIKEYSKNLKSERRIKYITNLAFDDTAL